MKKLSLVQISQLTRPITHTAVPFYADGERKKMQINKVKEE